MITLFELLEDVYKSISNIGMPANPNECGALGKYAFSDFVNNQNLCSTFINDFMTQDDNDKEETSPSVLFHKNRSTHIVITWLLGISLAKAFNLTKLPYGFANVSFERMWLLTAITHDYGYLRKELSNENLTMEDLRKPYDLYTDQYAEPFDCLNNIRKTEEGSSFFTYSYEEVFRYFAFRKEQLRDNKYDPYEKNDHGIVGGSLAFIEYCKRVEMDSKIKLIHGLSGLGPSYPDMKRQKVACFVTVSHNIYKSNGPESDDKYKEYKLNRLLSTSKQRVTRKNKLLLLLSLVDTIECTKRFSAKINPELYLQEIATLKRIKIDVTKKCVEMDFTPLYKYINHVKKSQEMLESLERHMNYLKDLPKWTSFKIESKSSFCVKITA